MYTIRQAASRSGVSVPLLRAWERRYGVVEPARTPAGYRLYDEASIGRLRAMRALIEDGWTPSNAAAHLLEGGDSATATVLEARRTISRGDAGAEGETAALIDRFVEAARSLDDRALEAVLDAIFARGSFERAVGDVLMPALVALGDGWASGTVDVASEHAASSAVFRRLGAAFLAAAWIPSERAPVLVGLPPGARHELGALSFATAARRGGMAVRYLGADLPVDDWIAAARQTGAAAAVVGVVSDQDVPAAARVSRSLRETIPAIVVAFGGAASGRVRIAEPAREIELPAAFEDAVERLRAAVFGKIAPAAG